MVFLDNRGLKNIMKGYWKQKETVRVGEILDEANKRMRDLPDAFKDKCINHFLGKCLFGKKSNRRCNFSHEFGNISDRDTAQLCQVIGPGVKRIVEAEQSRKRRRSD